MDHSDWEPIPEIKALHDAALGTMLATPEVAPNGTFIKAHKGGRPWQNAEGVRATSWGVYRLGYRAPDYSLKAA